MTTAKIDTGAITTAKLDAGAVTASKIASHTITADQILAGTITATELSTGAVTADKIFAGAVTADKIEAHSITADQIKAKAIGTDQLAAGAVKTNQLDAEAVTAAKIKAGTITATQIHSGAIETQHMTAGTIDASVIKANSITAELGLLAAECVGEAQIADLSVTAAKVASLNADVINAGTLSAERLLLKGSDGLYYKMNVSSEGITPQQLSDDAYKNALSGTAIVANSITASKIAAETITANEIASLAITTAKLDSNAVTADKIKSHEITVDKVTNNFGTNLDISSNESIRLIAERTNTNPNLLYSDELSDLDLLFELGDITLGPDIYYKDACDLPVYNTCTVVFDGIEIPAGNVEYCQVLVRDTALHPSFVAGVEPTYYIRPNAFQETRIQVRTEQEDGRKRLRLYKAENGTKSRDIDTVTYKNVRVYSGTKITTDRFVISNRAGATGNVLRLATGSIRPKKQYVLSFGKLVNYGVEALQHPTYALSARIYDITAAANVRVYDAVTDTYFSAKNLIFSNALTEMPFIIEDTDDTLANHEFEIRLYANSNSSDLPCLATLMEHVKLEEGEHSTVWTPSNLETMIKLSSLQVDLNGIEGRVEDAETNITTIQQTATDISLTVQGAGNNLLTGSRDFSGGFTSYVVGTWYKTANTWTISNIKTDDGFSVAEWNGQSARILGQVIKVNAGETYSFGCWVNSPVSVRLAVRTSAGQGSSWSRIGAIKYANEASTKSGDRYLHGKYTFTTTDFNGASSGYAIFSCENQASGSIKVWKMKVELGVNATNWAPSIDDGVQTSGVTINQEGIYMSTDGVIKMEAGQMLINSKQGVGNRIQFGEDDDGGSTFSVDDGGNLKAMNISCESLTVGKMSFAETSGLSDTGAFLMRDKNVIFSSTKPSASKYPRPCIWLEPTGGGGGGGFQQIGSFSKNMTDSYPTMQKTGDYDYLNWTQTHELSGSFTTSGVGKYTCELTMNYINDSYKMLGFKWTVVLKDSNGRTVGTFSSTIDIQQGGGTTGTNQVKISGQIPAFTGTKVTVEITPERSYNIRTGTRIQLTKLQLDVSADTSSGAVTDATCNVHYLLEE